MVSPPSKQKSKSYAQSSLGASPGNNARATRLPLQPKSASPTPEKMNMAANTLFLKWKASSNSRLAILRW